MWGYPLWLFLGLWLVLQAPPLERVMLKRIVTLWGIVSICFVAAFVIHWGVRPRFSQYYFAELYPGDQLGIEMSRRFRALTGRPLAYVIGENWDGGNVSHYAPEHPRVLIDGEPRRAPWIDLDDLRSHGAIVVWVDRGDPRMLPRAYRAVAGNAEVQEPFSLPFRLGDRPGVVVGWAVMRPVVLGGR